MEITVLAEHGFAEALAGLGLSYNIYDKERLKSVAFKLADKDGGHNKFLESIQVWLDIRAGRYWWQEFDTYRVGMTKQSESTIHTIMRKPLTQDDFEGPILGSMIRFLNEKVEEYKIAKRNGNKEKQDDAFFAVKINLPEGYMQRRIVSTNYKTLRNIVWQRRNHKLIEWEFFIASLRGNLKYSEILFKGWDDYGN